jgi:amino acid transporter
MSAVLTWLVPIMAWASKAADKASDAKDVPGIFKLLLPLMLIIGLFAVVGIAVMAIMDMLKKKVPLIDEAAEHGHLASGEMTRFESESRRQPVLGKVGAVIFLMAVGMFFFLGLYTMGRGSSTTEQFRKEGREKQKLLKKSTTSTSLEVGEDGDESGMKAGSFDGKLGSDMDKSDMDK